MVARVRFSGVFLVHLCGTDWSPVLSRTRCPEVRASACSGAWLQALDGLLSGDGGGSLRSLFPSSLMIAEASTGW